MNEIVSTRFRRGDFIVEGGSLSSYGIVLACGAKTFDVVWVGGSTSRYRHGVRDVAFANELDIGFDRKHLRAELAAACEERRTGSGIKRGQVWPSR